MSESHHFLPNSHPAITKSMLQKMRAPSVDSLFEDIPGELLLPRPLHLPRAMSEPEVERHLEELLSKNQVYPEYLCFLGGGVRPHHVPAAVDEVISRTEFYSSYTQYQPEISQGMLQALFEYQSLICDLTATDVANSSLYDWSTAAAEAARMAFRVKGRRKVLVPRNVGPERAEVMRTYCQPAGIVLQPVGFDVRKGVVNVEEIRRVLNDETAAIYIENPNFFGVLEEEVGQIADIAHRQGALLIVGVDAVSLGIIKAPGEYGADIVVGEGQPLGIPMNFGGPLLGILAAKGDPTLLRQMPGRIVGMTMTRDGAKRGFSLVLQTREQHIRRETATSNITTNQALCALAAGVYLALAGPDGLKEIAEKILLNSHYAAKLLSEVRGIKSPHFEGAFFSDFTISIHKNGGSLNKIYNRLYAQRIFAGVPLSRFYPDMEDSLLLSVTEVHTKRDIDLLAENFGKVLAKH